MIAAIIIISLTVNGLMMNPAYLWLIHRLNLVFKPFNCVYCLAWWSGVAYAAIQAFSGGCHPGLVVIPLAASFSAVVIDRWFNTLPVKIK